MKTLKLTDVETHRLHHIVEKEFIKLQSHLSKDENIRNYITYDLYTQLSKLIEKN